MCTRGSNSTLLPYPPRPIRHFNKSQKTTKNSSAKRKNQEYRMQNTLDFIPFPQKAGRATIITPGRASRPWTLLSNSARAVKNGRNARLRIMLTPGTGTHTSPATIGTRLLRRSPFSLNTAETQRRTKSPRSTQCRKCHKHELSDLVILPCVHTRPDSTR